MDQLRIENARITATRLGVEDHGIFTADICLSGDCMGCWFGGYALDGYDKAKKRRIGTDFGTEYIRRLLETLGVSEWEKLNGTPVRVAFDGNRAVKIGHFIDDKWFDPQAIADEFASKSQS
jgi:hypothetical protein